MKWQSEALLVYLKGAALNAACHAERQDRLLIPVMGKGMKAEIHFFL